VAVAIQVRPAPDSSFQRRSHRCSDMQRRPVGAHRCRRITTAPARLLLLPSRAPPRRVSFLRPCS
jgi:hypothetical protein